MDSTRSRLEQGERERRLGKLQGNGDRIMKPIFTGSDDTNYHCMIPKRKLGTCWQLNANILSCNLRS